MNKSKSTWIILGVVAVIALWAISSYNGLVGQEEDMEKYWANVEAQYDRRANLVPNLVNVVKGYAKHEEKVFTEVTEARTKIGQININAENMTDEQIAKFQKAQDQMSGALSKLMAVSEAYPELKANQNFLDLQSQLEGTENRITKAVTSTMLPKNIIPRCVSSRPAFSQAFSVSKPNLTSRLKKVPRMLPM